MKIHKQEKQVAFVTSRSLVLLVFILVIEQLEQNNFKLNMN